MPTYRVNYQHIGSNDEMTLEIPTESASASKQQLEDAIAKRLADRILPHAELAIRHEDGRNIAEKLEKAYDLIITDYQRV